MRTGDAFLGWMAHCPLCRFVHAARCSLVGEVQGIASDETKGLELPKMLANEELASCDGHAGEVNGSRSEDSDGL